MPELHRGTSELIPAGRLRPPSLKHRRLRAMSGLIPSCRLRLRIHALLRVWSRLLRVWSRLVLARPELLPSTLLRLHRQRC